MSGTGMGKKGGEILYQITLIQKKEQTRCGVLQGQEKVLQGQEDRKQNKKEKRT